MPDNEAATKRHLSEHLIFPINIIIDVYLVWKYITLEEICETTLTLAMDSKLLSIKLVAY